MIPSPSDALLFQAAAIIGIATVTVGTGAMGLAMFYDYRDRRRTEIRDRMRPELFERLFAAEPDWDAWVDTLSRSERRQVRTLLDEYLRRLRGTEHARLRELGEALGIADRARRNIESDRKRFRALTWLALLEESVETNIIEAHCADDPQARAGAARVLYRSGHPQAPTVGTALLIHDGERPLTAFGLDTLYRLNDGTETPLLSMLSEGADRWGERLLVQALMALRYCNIADPGERLGWLPALLAHDSPRVRSAAVGVVERHGWRRRVQERIEIETLLADPAPSVRRDTYVLLASWNDERSAERLRYASQTELDDGRDMFALARACRWHARVDEAALPDRFDPFVEWISADEAVGRRRHVGGVSAAWS